MTGPALIAALLALVWLDDRLDPGSPGDPAQEASWIPVGFVLLLLALLILPLASRELCGVMRAAGIRTSTWLTTLSSIAGVLSFSAAARSDDPLIAAALPATGAAVIFALSLLWFSRKQNVTGVLPAAGGVLLAFVYLGLFLGFFVALRHHYSAWLIVGIILTTKACDTGAYFTGRAIGRRKLIPWLSPGKTVEGLIGGLVLAGVIGAVLAVTGGAAATGRELPLWFGAACGVLLGGIGQLGDLTMSLFKRGAGVKDASHVLPGMGGIMDVMDSPLLVAPVAFWIFVVVLPLI